MIDQIINKRIAQISPQEVQVLKAAITPQVAAVLMKVLPELQQALQRISAQNAAPQPMMPSPMAAQGPQVPQGGALGGMPL